MRPAWFARACALFVSSTLAVVGCSEGVMDEGDRSPTSDVPTPEAAPEGPAVVQPPPINVAANNPLTRGPMDATPSPDGREVYYTALADLALLSDKGEPATGIFHAPADGGAIEILAVGAPLVAPVGITTSLDGKSLFVADSATGAEGNGGNGGAILTLPASGGTPRVLAGTAGYAPAGLVIAKVRGRERLYFSGRDVESGLGGVFVTSPEGGAVEALAIGGELTDPGGVAVAGDGTLYVVDALADGGRAKVFALADGGELETLVENIGVGFPAGLTLTLDDETLIVSGLDPATRKDLVYFVTVDSGQYAIMTEPVGAFSESAGLHRAHDANVFAWADSEANATGTVYVLKP